MAELYKKKFIFVSLILSIFITTISENKTFWFHFFGNIAMIPPQWPAFSDFDSINQALRSMNEGYDPYIYNPYDLHKVPYVYTKIWLYIFDALNFKSREVFLFCSFLILFFYFNILLIFFKIINNKYNYLILFIFLLSPCNTLIIERLNTDIVIFILIFFLIINKNFFIKNFFFILATALKNYPIFIIIVFLNHKKFFYSLIFAFFLVFLSYQQILQGNKNMIEYALIFAYGSRTFANALLKILENYNFFLNSLDYVYLKFSLIFFFIIVSSFFLIVGIKSNKKFNKLKSEFFLAGGAIYLGTFIFTSNVDYRLVFLLYTFPLIFSDFQKYEKIFLFACLVCFYSLWFQSGDFKSITFMFKAIFIYSLKFYIFLYLSYKTGSIIGNYEIVKKINLFK